MKRLIFGAALAALLGVAAQAQPAAKTDADQKNICINTWQIDHTSVPDARTILFHMRGGKIWKNTLVNDCPQLKTYGFIYSPTPPNQICGNMQSIRVIQTGAVCMLGAFTPYTPPPKEKPEAD